MATGSKTGAIRSDRVGPVSARSILIGGVIARTAYGLVSLFAPKILFSSADPPITDDVRYFNALFGGRDLTVSGLCVAALRNGREHEALLANVSCEATDLVALVQEYRQRGELDQSLKAGVAFNLLGWLSWAAAARALSR